MRFGIYIPEKRSKYGKLRRPARWYNDGTDNTKWVWGPPERATAYPSYKAAAEAILREGVGKYADPDNKPKIALIPVTQTEV